MTAGCANTAAVGRTTMSKARRSSDDQFTPNPGPALPLADIATGLKMLRDLPSPALGRLARPLLAGAIAGTLTPRSAALLALIGQRLWQLERAA